jgi:NADH-quinone oxidoreductase subunit G
VGKKNKTPGLDAYNMIEKRLSSYIFFNLEPENDFWNNISVMESLKSSKSNIFFSSFITPAIEKYADILIPITTFAETDGSFINIEGVFQSYKKIVKPSKNIFTGWSILNELLKINNLGDYSMDSLRKEIQESIIGINFKSNFTLKNNNKKTKENFSKIFKLTKRETYYSDSIVRRSPSLQATVQAKFSQISISSDIAKNIGTDNNIEIINDSIKHKINSFEIKSSLPVNTIVYPSSKYLGMLIGPKSGYINIKS